MKLESVRIQNLRAIQDQTINLDRHTTLVGANGSGKSTVLCALNVFFAASEDVPTSMTELVEEDFHNRVTSEPIRVTVTFTDLSDEAKRVLSHYVRRDKLVVTAQADFDEGNAKAKVKHFGQRKVSPQFAAYFEKEKDGARVVELRDLYRSLREQFGDLPDVSAKADMEEGLRAFEAALPEEDVEFLPSEDNFYGANGTGVLRPFIEWVYVPAVKDASNEAVEGTGVALKKLVARSVAERSEMADQIQELQNSTKDQYREILQEKGAVLKDLGESLEERLRTWAHPDARVRLDWKDDPDKSVRIQEPQAAVSAGEGEFLGEIARQGHGLQRSYLMALLEILAMDESTDAPTLVLGCEEPELYQHPPQAKHLAAVLESLAEGGQQVVLTTHSPYFVSREGFAGVRHVKREDGRNLATVVNAATPGSVESKMRELSGDATSATPSQEAGERAKIVQLLQPTFSEMFFSKRVVFVEGLEDISYIESWIAIRGLDDEYRKEGWSLVSTSGKSSMVKATVIGELLEIPSLAVFDGDRDQRDKPHAAPKHERDNKALAEVMGSPLSEPFPVGGHQSDRVWMWENNIGVDVRQELADSVGKEEYERILNELHLEFGHVGDLDKNSVFIGEMLFALHEAGGSSESLDELCGRLAGAVAP